MNLPHKISTLIYGFNSQDEILLIERAQEPNRGLWSPFGGKLRTDIGESPYACACRETFEEIGLMVNPRELHLTGIVSEHGYLGTTHWLMFLYELHPRLSQLPPPMKEGRFQFFARTALNTLPLPDSDREQLWPLFWQHRGGFFAAHCHCHAGNRNDWVVEESRPKTATYHV